jgi:glycosyltransferase involved in cell wall biosynthesis
MTLRPGKVLHLITGLGGGGAETLLRTFVTHARGRDVQHLVVAMDDEDVMSDQIRAQGIPVYQLGMSRGRPSVAPILRLWRIVSHEKPGVIHCWMYHANLLGTLVAFPRRIPLIWTLHAALLDARAYSWLSGWTRRSCALLSPLPSVIVANSPVTYEDHVRLGFKPRRWEIIGNGFDITEFAPDPSARTSVRQELGIAPSALLIGLFARFDPMKDQQTFLEAAALVHAARPDVHFMLAGADVATDNARLMELVSKSRLGDHVHILGFRKDATRLMAALDVATSSSVFGESFSNTIAEAMACAIPCVVTRVAALPYLVEGTGLIVPPRDPASMSEALLQLISLPASARQARGELARARIIRDFTIGGMIQRFETLYRDLMT